MKKFLTTLLVFFMPLIVFAQADFSQDAGTNSDFGGSFGGGSGGGASNIQELVGIIGSIIRSLTKKSCWPAKTTFSSLCE